jgi:hypothetical protein
VCPELRDTTSRWTVEYCIEEWRSNVDTIGPVACGTGAGNNDQAVTPIPSGTGSSDWASKYDPASSDTVDIGWPPSGLPRNGINIAATITATELKAALSQIQTTCAPSPLSSDPRDYQLIGVEQGHEIAGLSFRSGGTEKDLRLFTTYSLSNAATNSSSPYIAGTLAVNSPTSANPGSWSANVTTYAYQWNRCDKKGANCTAIPGATRSTYTPGTADAGYPLTVTVAAGSPVSGTTDLAWSAPATSSPSAPVARTPNKRGAAAFRAAAPLAGAPSPGPTADQLRAMLIRQLAPVPPHATSAAIRSAGEYKAEFTALVPGTVTISWYAGPNRSQVVAAGRRAIGRAGKGALAITLGNDGRRLLDQGKNLALTAEGVFTPRGGTPIAATTHFSLQR